MSQQPSSITLRSFFEEVYLPERLAQSSPHTVRKYRRTIEEFGLHLGRDASLVDLSEDNFGSVAASMRRRRCSERTIEGAWIILGTLCAPPAPPASSTPSLSRAFEAIAATRQRQKLHGQRARPTTAARCL